MVSCHSVRYARNVRPIGLFPFLSFATRINPFLSSSTAHYASSSRNLTQPRSLGSDGTCSAGHPSQRRRRLTSGKMRSKGNGWWTVRRNEAIQPAVLCCCWRLKILAVSLGMTAVQLSEDELDVERQQMCYPADNRISTYIKHARALQHLTEA